MDVWCQVMQSLFYKEPKKGLGLLIQMGPKGLWQEDPEKVPF